MPRAKVLIIREGKYTGVAPHAYAGFHNPLLSETKHRISEKELRMMKKTVYLINAARGPSVDEKALVKALREGWLAGAGLDVYENEPELTPGLD